MPHPQVGLFNIVLTGLGLPAGKWLSGVKQVMPSIAIMNIWFRLGFDMIIFLAGLQGIPETYYEAAKIDGAGRWQLLRYITAPLLRPVFAFVVIHTIIAGMILQPSRIFRPFVTAFVGQNQLKYHILE